MIKDHFPGALKAPEFGDSLLNYIRNHYQMPPEKILIGASTCVDDIIYTKNFHGHPEIKGPFHLGGLAGLPFTGISGLDAFAHHIPDSGIMLLMIEPHIGISEKGGWGHIIRHEQHEGSTCCGALMGVLDKIQKGQLKSGISEEDYQGDKISELAMKHQTEILSDKNPLIRLTSIISDEAERQIRSHVLHVDLHHIKYIIIITGILINTDYAYSDYQFISHFLVYDVAKKSFTMERANPLLK